MRGRLAAGGRVIEVPGDFVRTTVAREGSAGAAWIEGLPAVVDRLCRTWNLRVDGAVLHGYVGVVVPVVRDGMPLMLKVSWIDQSSEQEALALRAWGGEGAVRLLDADEAVGGMLLERLDPHRSLEAVELPQAVAVAGRLLRRLAVPAPSSLRTVGQEMTDLCAGLVSRWERAGRPFPRGLLDRALDLAAPGDRDAGLIVNQDLHYGNVLAGTREPWLVIDPKPLSGEPEFGMAQLLWNRFSELATRRDLERRLDRVVEAAELDRERAVRWSVVRLVDYWLWAVEEELTDDLARCRTLLSWLGEDEIG